MKENNKIAGSVKAIAFDADDTLWALQNYFEDVEDEYCDLLSDYGRSLCFFISKHIFLPQHQRRYESQHETEKGDRGKSDLA